MIPELGGINMDGGTGGKRGQANIEQGKHWMAAAFCCFAESALSFTVIFSI